MIQDALYEETSNEEHGSSILDYFSELPDYKLISEGAINLGSGIDGYEYVCINTEGKYKVKRRVVSIVRGTQALALITYALESDYNKEKSEINKVYNSLTFIQNTP